MKFTIFIAVISILLLSPCFNVTLTRAKRAKGSGEGTWDEGYTCTDGIKMVVNGKKVDGTSTVKFYPNQVQNPSNDEQRSGWVFEIDSSRSKYLESVMVKTTNNHMILPYRNINSVSFVNPIFKNKYILIKGSNKVYKDFDVIVYLPEKLFGFYITSKQSNLLASLIMKQATLEKTEIETLKSNLAKIGEKYITLNTVSIENGKMNLEKAIKESTELLEKNKKAIEVEKINLNKVRTKEYETKSSELLKNRIELSTTDALVRNLENEITALNNLLEELSNSSELKKKIALAKDIMDGLNRSFTTAEDKLEEALRGDILKTVQQVRDLIKRGDITRISNILNNVSPQGQI